MIQLKSIDLDDHHALKLKAWQKKIDDLHTYSDRVDQGKASFKAKNTNTNFTFTHVKSKLTAMCHGARRCAYCEDSVADEVEHIHPKDLYPELVFSWENYLYACGPCNGPKNNEFAVLRGRPLRLQNVTRPRTSPVVPPATGRPALINPRKEDPLHFLFLDLLNTFTFTVRDEPDVSPIDRIRAKYTLEVLHLNDRDYLVEARRTAFGNYRARLVEYGKEKLNHASQPNLDRLREELLLVHHRTVWREMQRQHASYPVLLDLFNAAPEALSW